MSKRKTTQTNKSTTQNSTKELSFSFIRKVFTFIDVQFKKIVGILLLFFALFLAVSCISYFDSWKADQNLVLNQPSFWNIFTATSNNAQNIGGHLGAFLANKLIYEGFGILSFLIIIFLFVWGFNLLLTTKIVSTLRAFFYTSLVVIFSSPVIALFLPKTTHNFPYGGQFGEAVISKLLITVGQIGTNLLMTGIGLTALILFFNPILKLPFIQQLFVTKSTSEPSATEIITESAKVSVEEIAQPLELQNENILATPTLDQLIKEHQEETIQPTLKEEIEIVIQNEQNDTTTDLVENSDVENDSKTSVEIELNKEIDLEPSATPSAIHAVDELDFTVEVAKSEDEILNAGNAAISVATDEPYDPSLDLRNYKFPTIDLLEHRSTEEISIDKNELEQNKNQIINTLKSFGIAIAKISATVGPTVTLYEIVPAEGVRISKIRNLEDDIALSLSALGIRIIAPIPGKGTIGIEVPNHKKQFVSMRTLLASDKFIHNDFGLPIALGKKIDNENYIVDLAKMPHLLMAGATGQGKSVGINTILVSLLYKKHPSQLKFVMVDPKKVELSIYKHIEKHFLAKLPNEEDAIITDTKKVINTLNALCIEMDNRYDLLKDAGVRNIREYNDKFIKRKLLPTKGHKYLPFIVLVVDEFADLIMTAGKEVEMPIARIAQLARAVGIHCIIATQRPSVNVITGTIKANFPGRVAFKVSAKVDSRTILDAGGAEQLIGQGDMLILNGSELVRLQCAFVDTPEVERIVEFIGNQQGYPTAFDLPEYEGADGGDLGSGNVKSLKDVDQMFEQCARLVVTSGSGSTSMLQRRFNLGYNRAGRIMDQLEAAGIVGASVGGKPRELMVHTETELDEILGAIGKF